MSVSPKDVSPKVYAASATALIASLITSYIAKEADPTAVQAAIAPLVTAGATFAAGWLARHEPKG